MGNGQAEKSTSNTTLRGSFTLDGLETTRKWNSRGLYVSLPETKGETISKHEILKGILEQNSSPRFGLFILAIVVCLPIFIFLTFVILFGWLFLIGVVGFAVFGGFCTWIAIDTETQRRLRLESLQDNGISFLERTCTDKKCGYCEVGEDIEFVHQLFFGSINYRVSQKVFDKIDVNDKLMFVWTGNEELDIAYPEKDWHFVD